MLDLNLPAGPAPSIRLVIARVAPQASDDAAPARGAERLPLKTGGALAGAIQSIVGARLGRAVALVPTGGAGPNVLAFNFICSSTDEADIRIYADAIETVLATLVDDLHDASDMHSVPLVAYREFGEVNSAVVDRKSPAGQSIWLDPGTEKVNVCRTDLDRLYHRCTPIIRLLSALWREGYGAVIATLSVSYVLAALDGEYLRAHRVANGLSKMPISVVEVNTDASTCICRVAEDERFDVETPRELLPTVVNALACGHALDADLFEMKLVNELLPRRSTYRLESAKIYDPRLL